MKTELHVYLAPSGQWVAKLMKGGEEVACVSGCASAEEAQDTAGENGWTWDCLITPDTECGELPRQAQLTTHWLIERAEYLLLSRAEHRHATRELLTLGSIRAIYWLALGQGETPLVTEIGDWWKEMASQHGLGETIL